MIDKQTNTARSLKGGSGFYRLVRRVLSLWFGLIFRRVRVLGAEMIPETGPVLFIVNYPAGFAEALLLMAALPRRVHCLLERQLLKGPLERLIAGALGAITCDLSEDQWPAALDAACKLFGEGSAILAFARRRQAGTGGDLTRAAAEVALEAEAYLGREAPLPVVPVHLFLPVPPSGAGEVLVQFDRALGAQGAPWSREPELGQAIRLLTRAIDQACGESPFRLQPDVVNQFLTGLESVMREDFAERWAHRSNWKQRVEDFDLSPFLVRLTHHLNESQPGRLAALNESLCAYEEGKRRAALRQIRNETAGAWRKAAWRRMLVWVETILGFPIACYGWLNLLIAWFIIWVAGLWKTRLWNASPGQWLARILIAIACYAGQIALVGHYFSRSVAGFYAPSLPVSGAYLIRYLWLLDHRTRVLAGGVGVGKRAAMLRRRRTALIEEVKLDQNRYAATLKIAH